MSNLPEEIIWNIMNMRYEIIIYETWKNKMDRNIRKIRNAFSNRAYDESNSVWAFQGEGFREPQMQGENCSTCGEYLMSHTAKKFCHCHF